MVETDRWFGPLFVNLRLIRTHAPIEFDANFPLLQVQPVHRSLYGKALDQFEVVPDLGRADARRTGTPSARPSCDRSTVRCAIRANTPHRPRKRRKQEPGYSTT